MLLLTGSSVNREIALSNMTKGHKGELLILLGSSLGFKIREVVAGRVVLVKEIPRNLLEYSSLHLGGVAARVSDTNHKADGSVR